MKKLAFLVLLFTGLGYSAKAQNGFRVEIGSDVCMDVFVAVYTNEIPAEFASGCTGNYNYPTGELLLAYIVVNGVICPMDAVTHVILSSGKGVTIEQKTARNVPRYIVKSDGIVY